MPLELSYARPASASTVRLGCAGIGRKPPTLVATLVFRVNAPAVLPVGLTEVKMVEAPEPPLGFWMQAATLPPGPMAMSPKFPPPPLGSAIAAPNAPTDPKPVMGAPRTT